MAFRGRPTTFPISSHVKFPPFYCATFSDLANITKKCGHYTRIFQSITDYSELAGPDVRVGFEQSGFVLLNNSDN